MADIINFLDLIGGMTSLHVCLNVSTLLKRKVNGDHTSDGLRERAVTPEIDELMTRRIWVVYAFLIATLTLDVADEKHCNASIVEVKVGCLDVNVPRVGRVGPRPL